MSHNAIQVIMSIVTVFALFADDFRLLFLTVDADTGYVNLTIIAMILFMIEIVLCSIGQEGYFNNFFFWLDLLSTLSLITDIPQLMELITGGSSNELQQTEASSTVRASRSAVVGSRAGRLTRIIRIIRLIRIVKLYKRANI